ncbi:MAG TPA: amino acid--tRNA ligase-related protein [Spirochaetia bacterium]|nr:amino acid--tRNA ligase-related protein [Spirochaetia bacterium]
MRSTRLSTASERRARTRSTCSICEYAKRTWDTDFVFVTGLPTGKRPFCTMDDPADPRPTRSFDLLFRGLEITTGGQRLHRYDDYTHKISRLGIDPAPFASYLQTFEYGMTLCGVDNVKMLSLFVRDID